MRRKNIKRWVSLFLTLILAVTGLNLQPLTAKANGWNLLCEKEFENVVFDGSNVYELSSEDVKLVSQLQDSLEISLTFKYGGCDKAYVKLMELTNRADNISESEDNGGGTYNPAKSTIAVIAQPSSGTVYLHTGAWAGSTAWQKNTNQSIEKGKYYTLTMSVAPDGLRMKMNDKEMVMVNSAVTEKGTTGFIQAFFGADKGAQFKDWRSSMDTISVGGLTAKSSIRHTNYGNFKGEVKSLLITDGGYSEQAFSSHHLSGSPKALAQLNAVLDGLNPEDYNAFKWNEFIKTQAYINAGSMTLDRGPWEIYQAKSDLETAAELLEGNNLDGIGTDISKMFDSREDNTWLFSGGTEMQGRFSEVAGSRNFAGHFEEYVRWVKSGNNQQTMQRYIINVGKAGQDVSGFEQKLDAYIRQLDPKAVNYMIGREDYQKGEAGIQKFKESLQSVIAKALAMKSGTGYVVIQLPHAVKDSTAGANIVLYADAAKSVISSLNADVLSRVVLVDHLKHTDNDSFKNGSYLTQEGLLNAAGHYEIAKQFADRTYGSTDAFPGITNWTQEEQPETYLDLSPAATAQADRLIVTIPQEAKADGWNYELQIEHMTIKGSVQENIFAITELPQNGSYLLDVVSKDGRQKLRTVSGSLAEGSKAGELLLDNLQKEIRTKAESDDPLTWMFMGDSITHGAMHTNGYDAIPQNFEKYLKEDLGRTDDIVINTAVSGSTAQRTLENIQQRLMKYTPDIVSIMLGTNDAVSVDDYERQMKEIVVKIRERNANASIIFRTPPPRQDDGSGKIATFTASLKKMAKADGKILLIDQYTDWNMELSKFPYLWGSAYYYGDGRLHPGAQGQLRMAQMFIKGCGLDSHKRIANLSYKMPFETVSSGVIPVIQKSQNAIMVNLATLQSAYNQGTIGTICMTLTDQTTGKIYTQRSELSGNELVMRNLPTNRSYTAALSASLTGSAKYVNFAEQEIRLEEGVTSNFEILLDRTKIKETAPGMRVGSLSVNAMAPDGTYSYELVSGDGSADNDKFELVGNLLKIKRMLEPGKYYSVRIKASNGSVTAENIFAISVFATLDSVRNSAKTLFEKDKMALDIDLSKVVFDGSNYADMADPSSPYYANGAYLEVLNNLREKTTGGTIIYRFRTSQANALIFGAGSSNAADNKNMLFGVNNGVFRGAFRTTDSGLVGDLGKLTLNDGEWHTVAISFDTQKPDYKNQILISVDGSDSIFNTGWWKNGWQSWFNITGEAITKFAIGGGSYSQLGYGGAGIKMSALNGEVSFVTVTANSYTEEELKILSETNLDPQKDLKEAISQYQTIYDQDEKNYTASTWSAFAQAFLKAEEAVRDGEENSAELNRLIAELNHAYAELKLQSAADLEEAKEALQKTFEKYDSVFNQGIGNYTEETWRVFAASYEKAADALKSENAKTETLIQLKEELEAAASALTQKPDDPKPDDPKPEEKPTPEVKPVKLNAPEIKTLKSVAEKKITGVKITVSKIQDADSYIVYRVSGNKIKQIGKVNQKGIVYDQDPLSGKNVSYYAIADSSNPKFLRSDAGKKKSIKLMPATARITVKVNAKKPGISVSWKKVKGAKGFVIYRSEKKKTGYIRVHVIKKGNITSFTDRKPKKGKSYYYRVVTKGAKSYSGIKTSKSIKVKK